MNVATLAPRAALGGILMGLANLVPGISGGTMLLASGVYTHFVGAIAELSTLKFRLRSIMVLGIVAVAAGLAIVLLAGPVKTLVVERRWIMYSLFIGLTLGGVPVVWKLALPAVRATWWGAAAGFAAMAIISLAQMRGAGESADGEGFVMLVIAGLAGASAMILPGVSGGYLLLVLGAYLPVLAGIDAFQSAIRGGDFGAAMDPALGVLLPVGIGVLAGIVGVSNLLQWLLKNRRAATLGVLLGFLVGAVVGLWPFQRSVEPVVGETVVKGQLLTAESLAELEHEDLPTEFFTPTRAQIFGSLGLVLLGLALTTAIARIGGEEESGA